MMALPICGVLIALGSAAAITEDSVRLRRNEGMSRTTARLQDSTGGGGL
jgi:hypothetical protein